MRAITIPRSQCWRRPLPPGFAGVGWDGLRTIIANSRSPCRQRELTNITLGRNIVNSGLCNCAPSSPPLYSIARLCTGCLLNLDEQDEERAFMKRYVFNSWARTWCTMLGNNMCTCLRDTAARVGAKPMRPATAARS